MYTGEGNHRCGARGSSSIPSASLVLLPVSSMCYRQDSEQCTQVKVTTGVVPEVARASLLLLSSYCLYLL